MLRRREFAALLVPAICPRLRAASTEFDPAALTKLTADLKAGVFPNTHAVLIEHDGRLVYEQYFAGTDQRWGMPIGDRVFDADSLHDLRSVSKSVTSAILGIALGEDFEKAVAQPIGAFFPHLKLRPELDALKLQHILTMTAGLEWNEMTVPYTDPKNDELQMSLVKDPVELVLMRPLRESPGARWYYNGGTTQVLAGVVGKVTGKPFAVFAKEALFAPLGITSYEWVGPPKWDPPVPAAASGLRLRARDLARFGSLYLNRGKWNGRQIVPAPWVERSLQRHVQSISDTGRRAGWGYGYQWWLAKLEGLEVPAAIGNGNQRVFLVPKERLAVTIFAGEYNKFEGHSERLFAAIMAARKGAR